MKAQNEDCCPIPAALPAALGPKLLADCCRCCPAYRAGSSRRQHLGGARPRLFGRWVLPDGQHSGGRGMGGSLDRGGFQMRQEGVPALGHVGLPPRTFDSGTPHVPA